MMRVVGVLGMEELVEIKLAIDNSVDIATKLRWQWETIRWQSAEKDNMEFQAIITCFQKEQIDRLFTELLGESTT